MDAVRLEAGDCVLLPNGQRFVLTVDPAVEATPFEELQLLQWRGGMATLNGGGEKLVLGGHFVFGSAHADVLLGAMQALVHLREVDEKTELRWALNRMHRELTEEQPGGVLVVKHLAHVMLVQALRLYLAGGGRGGTSAGFALADPKLAAAIGAIHAEPGARWTLPALASKAGMSRSSFARAFGAAVGVSPIEYLTQWRMLLAGTRLNEGRELVAAIARSLGYASEAAFSTAFKRTMGCAPRTYARSGPWTSALHPWATTALARTIGTDREKRFLP